MDPPSEQLIKGEKPPFTDWGPYRSQELEEQLRNLGINYTPPQEN